MWYDNITEAVGNTPLVRLNKVTSGLKPTILAKIEFFNPGGSLKDRMAFYMIREAERRGELKPGGTIVENTSGNTGIGLAIYAAVHGYRVIFTIPDKMSERKINLLRAFGAEVIVCPTDVPALSPESYYEVAARIARETPNSYKLNQYHNDENPEAHYKTTGSEIWEQTEHRVTHVVIGAGTGGTISGVGKFLKEKNPKIKVIGVDPFGSIYYDYFKHKKLIEPHVYQVEGIGEDMLCEAMHFEVIDDMIQVADKDSFLMARRLAQEEGIFAGGSSGSAVWAAIELAKKIEKVGATSKLRKESIIVTVLPDTGYNYINKIYSDDWMKAHGFL